MLSSYGLSMDCYCWREVLYNRDRLVEYLCLVDIRWKVHGLVCFGEWAIHGLQFRTLNIHIRKCSLCDAAQNCNCNGHGVGLSLGEQSPISPADKVHPKRKSVGGKMQLCGRVDWEKPSGFYCNLAWRSPFSDWGCWWNHSLHAITHWMPDGDGFPQLKRIRHSWSLNESIL